MNYVKGQLCDGKSTGAILDLFNDTRHALAQIEEIERWLATLDRNEWDTLMFYYVGHGMVHSRNDEFHMALFDTRSRYIYQSSLQASALAIAFADWSATKQVVMILDCCYAGAARNYMDECSDPMQSFGSFMRTAKSGGKPRGIFQLCAAGKDFRAIALDGCKYTMFTGAMLHVLKNGSPSLGPTFDLLELRTEIKNYLARIYPDDFVEPIVNVSEATDICSFFPNPSYRKLAPSIRKSDVILSPADSDGRSRKRPTTDRWRNFFSSDEIEIAVAMSRTFDPRLESVLSIKSKLAFGNGEEREWLVCTREQLYRVLDRPDDVEPFVDVQWTFDRVDGVKVRPELEILRDTKLSIVAKLGQHEQRFVKAGYFGVSPNKKLAKWVTDAIREDRPKDADILRVAGDLAVLHRLSNFLDSDAGEPLSRDLRSDLTSEVSEWAAYAAMLLARMRRRHPNVTKHDSARLSPVFEALCERPPERGSHRYWAQLAYVIWCASPRSESKRIPLLDKAIALRGPLQEGKRFARYEATRAVARIASDPFYRAGKRSPEATRLAILEDLRLAKPVIDSDMPENDLAEITRWLRRNGIALKDGDPGQIVFGGQIKSR